MVKFCYWQLRGQLLLEVIAHTRSGLFAFACISLAPRAWLQQTLATFYGNYWFSCLSIPLNCQFHEVREQVLFSLILGAQKMLPVNAWHSINCPNTVQQVLEYCFLPHCFIITLIRKRKVIPLRPVSLWNFHVLLASAWIFSRDSCPPPLPNDVRVRWTGTSPLS